MLSDELKLNVYDPTNKYFSDILQVTEMNMNYSLKHCLGKPNFTSFPDIRFRPMILPASLMCNMNLSLNQVLSYYSNTGLYYL